MIEAFRQWSPKLASSAWVHASAHLIGDVVLDDDVSIWPLCVLRGDVGRIAIGARTNVQDGAIAHATGGVSVTTIGADCTIGHRVTLHGCTVGDGCLVGMGSTLLDNCELGAGCFVAAGSLVTPGKKFEPGSFIVGAPAKRVREVTAAERELIARGCETYLGLMRDYRAASSR